MRRRCMQAGILVALVVATSIVPGGGAWGNSGGGGFKTIGDFDPANFPAVPKVDNRFLPFKPGMIFSFIGTSNLGHGVGTHRIITVVTDLVKVVNGVPTTVIYDRDFQDGELTEAELAFHAQDNDGTVWNLGEYPEEWENGKLQGAPDTWLSGVQRARAGIDIQAHPQLGTPRYIQGKAPAIEFLDVGKVVAKNQRSCVPTGCYDDIAIVDETSPLAPEDGHQLKFHAPGTGIVRIEPKGGIEQETVVLVKAEMLSPDELAKIREKALAQDARGYTVAAKVYGSSPPAQPLP
jgi:hypothetical protein